MSPEAQNALAKVIASPGCWWGESMTSGLRELEAKRLIWMYYGRGWNPTKAGRLAIKGN